jgi:uroporphyrinogen decarboxylase
MGYSIVPDHDFIINLESFNRVSLKAKDTALFSRGERVWAQEGTGLIGNWQDFEDFEWDKIDFLLEDYDRHLDFMHAILPGGMKLAVVGAVFYQVFAWLLGYEGLFYLLNDNTELVKAVIERVASVTLKMYEIAASKPCVCVLMHGDDLGFKTSTMISPQILRKLIFPWYKKYSDIAHGSGKRFWIHCCGYKEDIMEDLINDINMDALHSFEETCCPVIEYKKKYGSRTGILGGVDVDMLCRLDEDRLRGYVRKILGACMEGGRFALGSGNSVTNFVPVENYLIMLDEAAGWK